MDRAGWLQTRRAGIGGSDAAAILGLSPWRSPMDVWLDKKGLRAEKPDPDKEFLLDLGQRLEPVIAGLYEKKTGRELVIPPQIFTHPDYPILIASPDRLVAYEDHLERGVELKSENAFSEQFGDEGSANVPIHYALQCAHYMAVLNCPKWDVGVLHGGARFAVYELERDPELESMMIESLRAWWNRYIVGNVPPELDGSEAWRVYIHQKHPTELLPMESLPQYAHLMDSLARVRAAEKAVEVMKTKTENELKEIIGDRVGITTPLGRVTWKKTADARITDWENAYTQLRSVVRETLQLTIPDSATMANVLSRYDKLAEAYREQNTKTRPGSRRFLFTPVKGHFYGSTPNAANVAAAIVDADTKTTPALPTGDGERGTGGSS